MQGEDCTTANMDKMGAKPGSIIRASSGQPTHACRDLPATDTGFEPFVYNWVQVPLRMSVDAISFSAHADFPQTSEFIDELQPRHVVLVHGEATEMGRLKRALEQRATATGQLRSLYMPRVTQPVHITHKTSYTAKVGASLTAAHCSAATAREPLRSERIPAEAPNKLLQEPRLHI